MTNAKMILASCACGFLLAACGDANTGNQANARNDNYGSATDVLPSDGTVNTTNPLNSADIGIGGTPSRQSGNYQSQPLPGQNSDEELAKQIKVALTTGSMGTTGVIAEDQLTKIEVRAHDGVIVLSGPVSSEKEKETIEKQVAGMKGVKSVRNALTVGGQTMENKPTDSLVPRTPGNQ